MLVDANILLFAVDAESPFHAGASRWLTDVLNGPRLVGLPWLSLSAFLRIITHPRAAREPLTPANAWIYVNEWLAAPVTWVPAATERHAEVFGELVNRYQLRGNLIADADFVALAIEHGLTVFSADTDFARFTDVAWENPLSAL